MTGMQGFKMEISQVFSRLFYPLLSWRKKVQTTNDINNLAFPTDFFGIFSNIANPRTPGKSNGWDSNTS